MLILDKNMVMREGFIDDIKKNLRDRKFWRTPCRKISKPAVEAMYDDLSKEEMKEFLKEANACIKIFNRFWNANSEEAVRKACHVENKTIEKPVYEKYLEAISYKGEGLYAIHSICPLYFDFFKYSKEAFNLYEKFKSEGRISGSYQGYTEYDIVYNYVTRCIGNAAYDISRAIAKNRFNNYFYVDAYSMQAKRGEERTRFAYMNLVCMYKMPPKGVKASDLVLDRDSEIDMDYREPFAPNPDNIDLVSFARDKKEDPLEFIIMRK